MNKWIVFSGTRLKHVSAFENAFQGYKKKFSCLKHGRETKSFCADSGFESPLGETHLFPDFS